METIERPLQIIFIRHAESARNKARQGQVFFTDEEARVGVKGIPDYKIPLTEDGLLQAEKTGVYLREKFGAPDYVYHSGYKRTMQTLDGVLGAFTESERREINVRMNQFIRERDPGYPYDMTKEEADAAFPWLQDHWDTFGGFFSRPPGGESLSDVSLRDRAGKKVWVVLHGGTLRAVRFILERWDYERALAWPPGQNPENCGITVYDYDEVDARLKLTEYNTVCWR